MALKEVTIWNNRLQAARTAVDNIINTLPDAADMDRRDTFANLLICLREFGQRQYNYFRDGFQANPPTLETTAKFSAEYAVRQTIDQITFDLAILQRARNQRIKAITTDAERKTLARADNLSYLALLPAIKSGLIRNTAAITYFQKAPSVRIIPYADVALIGIPFTCLDTQNNARDFLAIPHEVGHHIFWHGRKQGTSLKAHLRTSLPNDLPTWAVNWLEEIFADVYGTYVAGPVIAYDFQELLFDNLNFTEDDGEHPVSAVRPYLYTETLTRIRDGENNPLFADAPLTLKTNWDNWRSDRTNSDSIQLMNGTTAESLTIAQIQQQLERVIDIVLDNAGLRQADNPWSLDTANIDGLYDQFFNNTLNVLPVATQDNTTEVTNNGGDPLQLEIAQVAAHALPQEVENPNQWHAGETRAIWFNFLTLPELANICLPAEIWSNLFINGGWASGGPEGDDNPG